MGTTADKLNQLINTKEGIRQEINRAYRTEEIGTSDTFNNYIQKLMEHPFYLNGMIDGTIESVKLYNATSIGNYAFYGCTSLTEASFPNATSVGNDAFSGCISLTTIDLSSIISIGNSTFKNCKSLKNLDISSVESIALPTTTNFNVKSDGAFYNCPNLTSLNLPGITSLRGDYFKPFGAPSIGYGVFNGSSLESISLPNITNITRYAFYDCKTLTTLYIGTNISTVCNLGNINAIPSNVANIYVPASLVDSYKSATNWSDYADKIKAAP